MIQPSPSDMACLDENTVVALAEGTLGEAARAEAEAHVDGCAACRALIAGVARTFGGGRKTKLDRAERPEPVVIPGQGGLAAGDRLGRYVLLHRLGEGGMGLVWAAYDPELNRNVAIKQVRRESDEPLEIARARLKREGQAMARLSHPNVVSVYDLFERDGAFYVAMEWVEGTTLRRWLEEGPRPWREVVAKFVEAGRGLAAAHDAGLIHRDFKPDNVFLGKNGVVRVGDFGLARELDATPSTGLRTGEQVPGGLPRLTQVGAVAGTPAYMAPEQRQGRRDVRSDQYSLCAALFEALTGRLPGADEDAEGEPGTVRRRPPRRVLRALERGLSPHPDDRFPTLEALLAALTADPWRAWRMPLWAACVLGVVLLGYGLFRTALHHRRVELCRAPREALSATWSAERAQAISRSAGALLAGDRWKRIEARLDAYVEKAQEVSEANCRGTGLELHRDGAHHWQLVPEPLFHRRAACVESARLRLAALASALEHPDATTAGHALLAAGALPPLFACEDARAFQVSAGAQDPARREALDRALAQAEVQVSTGHADAVDAAPLIAEARAVGDRSLLAEALMLPVPAPAEREANLYQAAWAAESTHADRLAVRAWTALAELLTAEEKTDDAGRAINQAQATLERLGDAPQRSARLQVARGRLALRLRRWTDAVAHLTKATEALEALDGALAPELVPSLTALAEAYAGTDRTADEIATRRRVLAIQEAARGGESPALIDALEPLVKAEMRARRWVEALADARRSLALREAAAQTSPDPALPLATYRVGIALSRLGRTSEARQVLEEARARAGEEGPDRALIELSLANLDEPPAP